MCLSVVSAFQIGIYGALSFKLSGLSAKYPTYLQVIEYENQIVKSPITFTSD
jgi:hypothetical protein